MARGFVYAGELTVNDLRNLLESLSGNLVHFVWTLKAFVAGEGIPEKFGNSGTAFNRGLEVRWQRTENEKFRVLLLSDSEMSTSPLTPIDAEWKAEEQTTYLFSLEDKRILPPFSQYPAVNSAKARLRCKVFYRDGVAVFFSPREVMSDEGATT